VTGILEELAYPVAMRVIGIDCATRGDRTGIAIASWNGGGAMKLEKAFVGPVGAMADTLPGCLEPFLQKGPTLLALDAPLGWPVALANALHTHVAGARLGNAIAHDSFFRRTTDLRVREHVGRLPLEVGANLIARTAFAALELLHALNQLGVTTDLLWIPQAGRPTSGVIEVYPAATFRAHGAAHEVYKAARPGNWDRARSALVTLLGAAVDGVAEHADVMKDSDHVLDAVACVAAARDFLRGDVLRPSSDEMVTAKREGWIWFKPIRA
jgi:Protein of unknown function (DUF429)